MAEGVCSRAASLIAFRRELQPALPMPGAPLGMDGCMADGEGSAPSKRAALAWSAGPASARRASPPCTMLKLWRYSMAWAMSRAARSTLACRGTVTSRERGEAAEGGLAGRDSGQGLGACGGTCRPGTPLQAASPQSSSDRKPKEHADRLHTAGPRSQCRNLFRLARLEGMNCNNH